MSNNFEKLMEEKFKRVYDSMKNIEEWMEKIYEQTKKTNGRVTRIESIKTEPRLKQIEKETEIIRFFMRHKKISGIIAVLLYLFATDIRSIILKFIGLN